MVRRCQPTCWAAARMIGLDAIWWRPAQTVTSAPTHSWCVARQKSLWRWVLRLEATHGNDCNSPNFNLVSYEYNSSLRMYLLGYNPKLWLASSII